MVEQQSPARRCVAFKVIKLGMDTRQVIARFEAERQALRSLSLMSKRMFPFRLTNSPRPMDERESSKLGRMSCNGPQSSLATAQMAYRFSEVVHRRGRGTSFAAPAPAGEQLRRRLSFCYFESGRRTNSRFSRPRRARHDYSTAIGLKVTAMHTQDAGIACLALYDLQPVA